MNTRRALGSHRFGSVWGHSKAPQNPPIEVQNAVYLYGIIRSPEEESREWGTGVGDPPSSVAVLPWQGLAAVVSEVSAATPPGIQVIGLRRDMAAHSDVLIRLLETTTVLPARFGVCLADREAVIRGLLEPQSAPLLAQLERLSGAVELSLHVRYRKEAALEEVRQAQPVAAVRSGGSPFGPRLSFADKLERGRRIVAAVEERGRDECLRLMEQLQPLAREVELGGPASELTVLKGAFLVDRERLEEFDRSIETLCREREERMEFDYVGPLPPYSFTRMRLPLQG